MEHLVVATQRDTEDDRCDILEAVDPLLAFWPLAPDIEEPEVEVFECEMGFYDASCFDPGSEDILLRGLVVCSSNSI